MKRRILTLAGLALVLSSINLPPSAFAQGSLTPPGPPGPMMKTLAQIEPRTPISSLPYTITNPGSYYLTTSLTNPGVGNGLTISSGNVTFDLNGFTLQGIPVSDVGIYVSSTYTNLVVRNGTVTGWGSYGINAWSGGYPRNMLFEKLTVSANGAHGIFTEAGSIIRDCMAIGNGGSGFFSQGGEIIGCLARDNNIGFRINYGSLLHCSAEYNGVNGFYLSSSRALDCDCLFNSVVGIICDGAANEIRRCRIMYNGDDGIFFHANSGGNVIEGCEIANNSSHGIDVSGAGGSYVAGNNISLNTGGGILVSDSNNYIENNHVLTANGVTGIGVAGSSNTNNVVAKNVVAGGGSAGVNYNVPFTTDLGPVGSAASIGSPWANISH